MTNKFSKTFISILLGFLVLSSFANCKIQVEDDEHISRPDIDTHNSSFKLAVKKISADTDYINVYRKDDSNVIPVGMIFPKSFEASNTSYIFEDLYVLKDKSYSYMVRYHNKDGSTVESEWTDSVKASFSTVTDKADFMFTLVDNKVSLEKKGFSLTFPASTPAPGTPNIEVPALIPNAKPMLAIKTSEAAQLFLLDEAVVNSATPIPLNLRGFIPESFYGKEMTIIGLVAQKEDKNADDKIMRLYWTEPAELNIVGATNNKITVPLEVGSNGYDYSTPSDE